MKSTVVNKQFADNENMKYSENSNTGILTMSANLDTRFFVQNTNYGRFSFACFTFGQCFMFFINFP